MPQQEHATDNKQFGRYLRRIREERRLSLDSVEEMSFSYPDRITKSHLSRIENGRAVPTFPRMFTLSQIYGVPVASLADRFEVELRRAMAGETYTGMSWLEMKREADRLRVGGRYVDALMLMDRLLERTEAATGGELSRIKIDRVVCLYQLGRYSLAKEESEELLSEELDDAQKVRALQLFIVASYRLGRFTVAWMALDHAFRLLDVTRESLPSRMRWDFHLLRGNVFAVLEDHDRARDEYQAALDGFTGEGLDFEVCRLRVNISGIDIEQGRFEPAEQSLQEVLERSEHGRYDQQAAIALSNLGLIKFRTERFDSAEAYLVRSNTIARPREYASIVFRNCYYLWKIAESRGDQPTAVAHERSLRTYLGRIEERLPEADAYRAYLTGAES